MPVFRRTFFALLIMAMTAGCSGGASKADAAIGRDLERYLSQLSLVTGIEVEAIEANKKAVEAPNADDRTYARALRETVIPKLEEFERELANMHPATNEILGIHNILLKRSKTEVAGFKALEEGGRTGSAAAIEKANALFADAKFHYNEWSKRLAELAGRYPVSKRGLQ